MKILHYILNQKGEPVVEPDLMKWSEWLQNEMAIPDRIVRVQYIGEGRVSTVFLGLNTAMFSKGPPVVWETMVFGGPLNGEMTRCAGSREQAMAMHEEMIKRVQLATIGICND